MAARLLEAAGRCWLVFLFKYKNRKTRDRYPNLGELVNRTTWKEFEQKEYRQTAIFRLCRSGPAVAVGAGALFCGGMKRAEPTFLLPSDKCPGPWRQN